MRTPIISGRCGETYPIREPSTARLTKKHAALFNAVRIHKIQNKLRSEFKRKCTRNAISFNLTLAETGTKPKQPSPRQRQHGVYHLKIWNSILDITHLAHLNCPLGRSYSQQIIGQPEVLKRVTHIAIATLEN